MYPYDDNPELASLRAEYQAEHGLSIAYIKKRVGAGMAYSNEVAEAVLSAAGGYFQLRELPEEFAGAVGDGVTHGLISNEEAWEIVHKIKTLLDSVMQGALAIRSISLYALYAGGSLQTRQGLFVFDQKSGEAPFTHGEWHQEVLPRFFKLSLESGDTPLPPSMGLADGILFFLAPHHHDDGRCLLATLTRTPTTQDLGALPAPTMMN